MTLLTTWTWTSSYSVASRSFSSQVQVKWRCTFSARLMEAVEWRPDADDGWSETRATTELRITVSPRRMTPSVWTVRFFSTYACGTHRPLYQIQYSILYAEYCVDDSHAHLAAAAVCDLAVLLFLFVLITPSYSHHFSILIVTILFHLWLLWRY